ncbi:hypothetical protein ARAM_001182 [Aspergillus rambellii]|uniref:Uncharacterized protein n=1 Tax=Aspergillus rambellii TaxID=308745 RepID=A0A0F8W4J9_9EURO|nr:hypothetical protein ARAM_001182 [Aspergillus rambellii]
MRPWIFAFTALAISVLAQDPGPSPTESVGCKPHGDHWHCDGPASSTAVAISTHSHGDNDDEATITPTAPSPMESVGCEPHGDHWHCDGPAETSASATSTSTSTESPSAAVTDDEGAAALL